MTSRKNTKTTGKTASGKNASEQSARGGVRKFFQRLCIYGLTLIGMLLIYFVMGGDSKKLIGIKNPNEIPPNQTAANGSGVTHSTQKPAMDENGNPIKKVSADTDMFGSDFDDILGTGDDPEFNSMTGSETSPGMGYGSEYGTSSPETPQAHDSSSAGGESPMVGSSGSESGNSSGETSGSSSGSSSGYGSDYSGGSSSGYSGGSSSDYSSGSGSDYSGGSSSDYSNGSGSDYSGGSGSDYSGGSSSGYSGGSSSGYSGGSSSDYSGGSSSGYSGGSSSDYSSGSSSGYSGGSSSDYSSGSSSGYSGGSSSGYSSSSGSDFSSGSSSGSAGGLVSSTDTSGSKADSLEGVFDFPPETPPIKNYKEGVVTGPDGVRRHDEVKILEVGRGEPVKNHFGPAVTDFLDLFDFSITPDWVEANWSSVAIVGPLTTRGYRVPISTGPELSDLVGSLTYYFNNRLELEKITFEGYTGDLDRLLISLKYFNLTKRITSDPNALLYLSEELSDNRRSFLKSYFRLQSHDKAEPNKRYWLTMELYPPEK